MGFVSCFTPGSVCDRALLLALMGSIQVWSNKKEPKDMCDLKWKSFERKSFWGRKKVKRKEVPYGSWVVKRKRRKRVKFRVLQGKRVPKNQRPQFLALLTHKIH